MNQVEDVNQKLQDLNLPSSTTDPTIELSKKLKRLRKRLRESELLEEKVKSSELQNPEKDQLEKIANRKTFEDEIKLLEAERDKLRKLKTSCEP